MIYPLVFWIIVAVLVIRLVFFLRSTTAALAARSGRVKAICALLLPVGYLLVWAFLTILAVYLLDPLVILIPKISDFWLTPDLLRLALAILIFGVTIKLLDWEVYRPGSVQTKGIEWLAEKIAK